MQIKIEKSYDFSSKRLHTMFVHSGYHNKNVNRNIFISLLEARKSKIKVPADSVSGRNPLPGSQTAIFLYVFTQWKGEGTLRGLFYKGTNPIHEASTLITQKCQSLSHVQLFVTPQTVARQAPLSRQEYWQGLLFPSPGDLPKLGIEPGSPALQADSLPSQPPGKPSCPNPFPKTPPPNVITLEIMISTCEFGETTNIQSIAYTYCNQPGNTEVSRTVNLFPVQSHPFAINSINDLVCNFSHLSQYTYKCTDIYVHI